MYLQLSSTKAKQRNTSLAVLHLPAGGWLWTSLITGTEAEKPSRHETFSSYSAKNLSSPCKIHIFPCTAQTPIHINKHECQRTSQNIRILPWHLKSGLSPDLIHLGVNFIGQELSFSFVAAAHQVFRGKMWGVTESQATWGAGSALFSHSFPQSLRTASPSHTADPSMSTRNPDNNIATTFRHGLFQSSPIPELLNNLAKWCL